MFHLRAIVGLTNAEVAETLGLTTDQVRSRLHRMMTKFRDLYSRRRAFEESHKIAGNRTEPHPSV